MLIGILGDGDKLASTQAYDFINSLLDPDPETRIGTGGLEKIKNHSFFTKVCKGL